jgi:hypothetical protein
MSTHGWIVICLYLQAAVLAMLWFEPMTGDGILVSALNIVIAAELVKRLLADKTKGTK